VQTYGVSAINRSMYDVPCPSLWGLNCSKHTTFTCPGNPDEICGGKNESVYSMYGYINNIGKYNFT